MTLCVALGEFHLTNKTRENNVFKSKKRNTLIRSDFIPM